MKLPTFILYLFYAARCSADFCPRRLYRKGVLGLEVNPAFLNAAEYDTDNGEHSYGLTISSFFHNTFSQDDDTGMFMPNQPPFAPDQVGRIADILDVEPDEFDFTTDYEKVTGPNTTWPNDARRVPDGVLPFEGLIVPQGFHAVPTAGRLSIIKLDDLKEYIVHESTLEPPFDFGAGDIDKPRFFHKALFYDMDNDGLQDIVTVRSGFKISPTSYPPFSELVYYKNPGKDLDPEKEWEEHVLYGGTPADPFGPDISLAMHDFEGDGSPQIVGTHYFTGDDDDGNPSTPPTKGKIVMYGAPLGGSWKDVGASNPPRVKLIDDSNGFPFSVEIVDLNGDGKTEILATNHQPNCFPGIQGRVYALEQPASGDIFSDDWTVHVLSDGILPQPTPAGARGMRLAPGHAFPFYPNKQQESGNRPWILVSGDEAGKVWMMKPVGSAFEYDVAIVFDINDYYGNETTQSFTSDGFTVSTIGKPAIFYDEVDTKCEKGQGRESPSMSKQMKHGLKGSTKKRETTLSESSKAWSMHESKMSKRKSFFEASKSMDTKSKGSKRGLKVLKRNFLRRKCAEKPAFAEIYIPVFEAQEIHILSFDGDRKERINCPVDVTYACL